MKTLWNASLGFLLAAAALTAGENARAGQGAAGALCQRYGFAPHTSDYKMCRQNARHYWNTGPCTDGGFAAAHKRYCNLIPTIDF
jgi:hypothetical protein